MLCILILGQRIGGALIVGNFFRCFLLHWYHFFCQPYLRGFQFDVQFDDISYHGTKVIVYNLWLNDEGTMELDFDSDPEVRIVSMSFLFFLKYSCLSFSMRCYMGCGGCRIFV